ncbi:class-II fumarase/aspartase family protein [Salinicola peritrichatus]|uniref:class-II fumarase/aspartase family protein n=1 Tax=Salinicola peritrichatus TaxID=1267424 RepID=UPI0019550C71|nr:adenylosuccinate lyase family protein [Salinicola peritrichatus]
MLTSSLFKDAFGSEDVRLIFEDAELVAQYTRVEVALAQAQAKLGIVPQKAADTIAATVDPRRMDMQKFKADTENVGYPILPLVEQLSAQCGEAGGYLHWGATTQDIMDTALILQLRAALELIETKLSRTRELLAKLAAEHRDTAMAGRTHLQHALPVTFGYKVAVWLSMFDRHQARLDALRPRLLQVSFSGAAGTLASLQDQGLEVQRALAEELSLGVPDITWHTARDSLAEVLQWFGLVTASLGKVAQDVMLLMTDEIGEVMEPFVPGRGASSTMPQKRNPISCEIICANAKVVRQHAALMLDAMVQDFERATGPWQAEWFAIPESCQLTAGALEQAVFMLSGLEVRADRMQANLGISRGLIVAEAVMMAMAPHCGRQHAHEIVYEACRAVHASGETLAEVLLADERITQYLDEERIRRLTDPANYVGQAPEMVTRLLAARVAQ